MSTGYPNAIDTTSTLPDSTGVGAQLNDFPHSALHGNANDAIRAIQNELGTAPSGSFSNVKSRFDAMDAAPTAVTLTNDWETATGGEPLEYRKIGNQVTLVGSIMNGTADGIGTLPSGFRPAARAVSVVGSVDDPGSDDPGMLLVGVNSDGTIVVGATFYGSYVFASPLSLPDGVHINMTFWVA